MKKLLVRAVLAALAVAGGITIAMGASPDPVIGTWQLNVARSAFASGPAFKSQTRTYSQSGESYTLIVKTVRADGKEITTQSTYQCNGKDFPLTGSPDYADSLAVQQVDRNTVKFTVKKAGKVVVTGTRIVSKDGKTLTLKNKDRGEKSEDVLVFDKQ